MSTHHDERGPGAENPGRFRKGFDPRRHRCTPDCTHPRYEFTAEDRSNGFWSAIAVMGVGIGPKLKRAGRWEGFRGRRRGR